ncbi:hypothetical protein [Aeromonas aquatica]|uniref:hypothetical protein n=1 Tax=Aeromonas aquatica TaxID=558964 RepID=UPI00051B3D13|nr:hypothetical protein [Aeromonas aquatica]
MIDEIADVVLSPEALDLVVSVAIGAVSPPVAIGALVIGGLAAVFLPKDKARALMSHAKGLIGTVRGKK